MRLPEPGSLPPGYTLARGERGVLAWRTELAETLREHGYEPDAATPTGAFEVSEKAGRRPLFELRTAGRRLLLRRFSHGGLLRGLTGERFRDPDRPFAELRLSEWLRHAGVRTPRVAAARARAAGGWRGGWNLDVVTECVEETTDLGYALGLARGGHLSRYVRAALLEAAGRHVGALHRLGFWHADLQPNNLLVNVAALAGAAPEIWVLDLDRSERFDSLPPERRWANLERLFRHVARGATLTRADCARFLSAYASPGGWRDDWRAVADLHARRAKWHRLGWRIERLFGLRRDHRRAPAS